MSNHPDDFKGTPYDVTPAQVKAAGRLEQVHSVYREVLAALVGSCVKNRIRLSKHEVEVAMEGVGEALADEAAEAIEQLPSEAYTPADAKQLVERAHGSIVDALRVKPLDWSGTFNDLFGPVPTNPATPGFGGDGQ